MKYNDSAKGVERRKRYNVTTRRELANERYNSREFVAWDGEGGNLTNGEHVYFLLANSDGLELTDSNGIATVPIFEMMLESRSGVINVIYGGGYDFNMILRDLPKEKLEKLYSDGRVYWGSYFIQWRGSKSFSVKDVDTGRKFLIYDVLPFFQRTFVKACDEYLGDSWSGREQVISEKARRGSFDFGEIELIREYNRIELNTLVQLANELRSRLYRVGIKVTRWDGPGAIATALFKTYKVKEYMGAIPEVVNDISRYAYAGGRFEILRKGHSEKPAYQYDIRSAYPSAAVNLPCLACGEWIHKTGESEAVNFGMYRIKVEESYTTSQTQPHPLWMRNRDGTVYFSRHSEGWYWTPEAKLAVELGHVVSESWEYVTKCDHRPFSFVSELYKKRAELKAAGDGANIGIKLGLNSLYGKLAQQIGWDKGPPLRLPPYHCLEWAGYITSHCRSEVYRAAMIALDDVIAFETDAIFTRVPLALPIGTGLGEWEEKRYQSLTYVKSGMYFGTDEIGVEVEKSRGINKGTLTRAQVIEALDFEKCGVSTTLNAEQTRFIGLGQALSQSWEKWRTWETKPRIIAIRLNGKRIDLLDENDSTKEIGDGWRETQDAFTETEFSYPYEVEWITDSDICDPNGNSLAQIRIEDAHLIAEDIEYA